MNAELVGVLFGLTPANAAASHDLLYRDFDADSTRYW
jgi:hypothetical protein